MAIRASRADLNGDILLEDGEHAQPTSVTVTPDLMARYKATYRHYSNALSDFARTRGAGLVQIDADRPVRDQLSALFGQGGVRL